MYRAAILAFTVSAGVVVSHAVGTCDPSYQCSFSQQHAGDTYSWDLRSLCADEDRIVEAVGGESIHFRLCGNAAAACRPSRGPTVKRGVAVRFWGGEDLENPCYGADGAEQPCPPRSCEVLGAHPGSGHAVDWEPIVETGKVVGARFVAQSVPAAGQCEDATTGAPSRGVVFDLRCDRSVPGLRVDGATEDGGCRRTVHMRSRAACPVVRKGARDQAEAGAPAPVGAVRATAGWSASNCGSAENRAIIELGGECRTFDVPKQWDLPSLAPPKGGGQTIDFFVRRFRANASAQSPHGSLWLLGVEPGDSGASVMGLVEEYLGHGWDVYVPDHRGTGQSHRLHCASDATQRTAAGTEVLAYELAPCLHEVLQEETHGDLALFSTTMAAADVLHTARAERASNSAPVYVIGLSYGALLGLRVLQVEEEAGVDGTVKGMVLDSPIDPGLYSYLDQLQYPTASMATLMQACGADPRCADRVGRDPVDTLQAVLRALDSAPAPPAAGVPLESAKRRAERGGWFRCWDAGFDGALLRRAASLLPSTTGSFVGLPALLRRLLRCAPEDVTVLQRVAGFVRSHDRESLSALFTAPRSGVEMINVALGESQPVDTDEYFTNAELVPAPLASSLHPVMRAAAAGMWPTYKDTLSRHYPSTRPPKLLLAAGAFDGTTPQVAASRLFHRMENRTTCAGGTHGCLSPEVLFFPAPHLLSFFSPVRKAVADCFVKFLKGSRTPKDCLLQDHGMDPHVNFSTAAAADSRVFGTADVWGDFVATPVLASIPTGGAASAADLSSVRAFAVVSAVFSFLTLAAFAALVFVRYRTSRRAVARDAPYANML